MRILHVIDSGGMYGAEVMLLNLVEEQIRQGLEPAIASIGEHGCGEKALEREARKRNFRIATFRMRPGPNFIGILRVINWARSEGCMLFHAHGYKSNILLGLMPRRVRKLPLVSTVHGWTATNGLSKMKLYEYADRISLRFADAVVLVNRGMLLLPCFQKSRMTRLRVIDNGISDRPVHREECRVDIEEFCRDWKVIGAIGRLSEEKGFGYLVEAFGKVGKQFPDVRLLILGEGPERERLQDLVVRLGLRNLVLMPGFVEEASRYLPLFDVLAIPSLSEGLPITLLEAMREGVPVVASAVGGIPDVLGDGEYGLLVPPRDQAALEKALLRSLFSKDEMSRLAKKGQQRFFKRYSSARMCAEYSDLYREIAPV